MGGEVLSGGPVIQFQNANIFPLNFTLSTVCDGIEGKVRGGRSV